MGRLLHTPIARLSLLGLLALASLPACTIDFDNGSSSRTTIRSGNSYSSSYTTRGHSLSAEAKGTVLFNADETDVAGLDPKGRFEIVEEIDDVEREYRVQADSSGALTRTYRVDGKEQPIDAAVEQWRASVLQRLFRENGFDAEAHVGRLLSRGGVSLVLDEVELSSSDYGRATMLRALIASGELDDAGFLRAIAETDRVSSDYERSRVLIDALARRSATTEARSALLEVAADVDSDYELSRVLQSAIELPDTTSAFLAEVAGTAARNIDSDYECGKVLAALAAHADDGVVAAAYLDLTGSIDSDYERGRALMALAPRIVADPTLNQRYRELARSMGKYERGRALTALDDASAR